MIMTIEELKFLLTVLKQSRNETPVNHPKFKERVEAVQLVERALKYYYEIPA